MRVLLTGMSATGKSTLVQALRRRGFVAYDADDDGFSEPRGDGRWGWRRELVAELLAGHTEGLLFFAGCSEEQADLPLEPLLRRSADLVVASTAPPGQIADEVLEGIASGKPAHDGEQHRTGSEGIACRLAASISTARSTCPTGRP